MTTNEASPGQPASALGVPGAAPPKRPSFGSAGPSWPQATSPRPDSHPNLPGPAPANSRSLSNQLPSSYWDRKMASDMSRSGDTRTQLFVGNLPFRVRWQDLKDFFRRSGTVLRADVALTAENRSKGFGTVLFSYDVDAYRAIEMFNGFNWQSRVLDVRLDHQDPTGAIALSMAAQAQPVGVPLPGAQNWQHVPMMQQFAAPAPPPPMGMQQPSPQPSFHGAQPIHAAAQPQVLPATAAFSASNQQPTSRPSSSASGRQSDNLSPQPSRRHQSFGQTQRPEMMAGTQSSAPPHSSNVSPPPLGQQPQSHSAPHVPQLAHGQQHQQQLQMPTEGQQQQQQMQLPQANGYPQSSMMPMFAMMPSQSMPYQMMGYPMTQNAQQQRQASLPPAAFAGRHLFVGNLPFNCQWQDLKDLFRQAGNILRADVTLGPDGRSRGFGTVLYATQEDAQTAVDMFNGYDYRGRPLKVHFDRYAQQMGVPGASAPSGNSPSMHSGNAIGIGKPPARSFTPPVVPSMAQRAFSGEKSGHRHVTGPPGPQASMSAPVVPTFQSDRRATTPVSNATQSSVPPPNERPSNLSIDTTASSSPDRTSGEASSLSESQSGNSSRQAPGPLHFTQQERFSTGPAALMSPPAPMSTPGFHPFSPQSARIAMTPSMPGFSFHPFPPTPPLVPQFLSPGLGPFSPPLAGGSFASQVPSYLNPAPGAPIHLQMEAPGTPSLDHVMSNEYFSGVSSAQPPASSSNEPDQPVVMVEPQSSSDGGSTKHEKSPATPTDKLTAEPSYFPPVDSLMRRSNSNNALASPAVLKVAAAEEAQQKRSRSTVERPSTRADLGLLSDRMGSLGITMGESALDIDDVPDSEHLMAAQADNSPQYRRASLYEAKSRPAGSALEPDPSSEQVSTPGGGRRVSFEDDANKRKERVEFGKSIWT